MNWPGAMTGPGPSSRSSSSVHVSTVSCARSTTWYGTGVIAPDSSGSAATAVAIEIQEPEPSPLEPLDQHLRKAAHQVVAECGVGVALPAQTDPIEGRGAHVRQCPRVEVPPIRREQPRPADDLAGLDRLDRDRAAGRDERLERDRAVSDDEERVGS